MRWLNDIAARAASGFALVSGVTAATVVGSAVLARSSAETRERILVLYADDLAHASQAQVAAERMVAVGRGYLLTNEPELLGRVSQAEAELDVALQSLERADAQRAERALLREVERSAAGYRQLLDDIFETAATSNPEAVASALRERLLPAREDLDARLGSLVAHKERLQIAARKEAARLAARSVRATVALGGAALVLSGLLAWLFTRRLAEIHRREQESARRATLALAAKEDLLGIVAHDLRSPLSAILLRASSIAKTCVDPKVVRSAGSIQLTCKSMAHLIQSLLDAASLEAGRMSVVAEPIVVESIIADTMETFAPAASERCVQLQHVVTPPDLGVFADRERLFQVLSNLVGNALKFTPEGGEIRVSASGERGSVRFEVRDTGPGILPEQLPHIFERYWKADPRGRAGAGLGLYIAKGIVEAHHGHIWAESGPGRGSSFQFELPATPTDDGRRGPSVAAAARAVQPLRAFVDPHVHH